ncbi:hypothetical protein BaRGS_00015442 [Batillaria attramentaria]|uniref:CARD domain-containing protein n=1 Tax=Batillaria attramentaria TaxID=370345 RepID=A0ABD0L1F6_9CAEN
MAETYTDFLEENRWVLVRSVDPEPFLDYLRSHHVVSDVDCETITNRYVYQTRRARMGCFIDILRTKGPDGVNLFFTQLGWEYPHIYREIFRKDPDSPPTAYKQGTKSRISCNLDNLLKAGIDFSRLRFQQESLAQQLTDMEAMVKHQRNEIEDLERENQRLRHFERDNQQVQERLRTLTATNDEIKEENRQFLHEIRTLTLDLQKHRNNEADLQGQLDEVTQQIQEKSLELNRKKEEESDLRAKFERVRQQSLKIQNITQNRLPRQVPETARLQQDDLKRQLDSLMEDVHTLESTNKGLCEQLRYMQDLLDDEKTERDQMHRRVCVLEHEKGNLETRLNTAVQKIERYYTKIKELEAQKMKLEEERMHMQQKVWETSQSNERQFDQVHKLEARLDQVQQDYQKFRQEHRYCTPGEPWDLGRDRRPNLKARNDPGLIQRSGLSPHSSPNPGNDDPFKFFTSYNGDRSKNDSENGSFTSPAGSDGDVPTRTDSTKVHLGSVRKRDPLKQAANLTFVKQVMQQPKHWRFLKGTFCMYKKLEPDDKHNLIVWEARPKDHNSDVYKRILGNNNLQVEFKQEMEKQKELEEFVHKVGLHSESLTIRPGEWTSESFWKAVKEKVTKVQQQVFWLEASQRFPVQKV